CQYARSARQGIAYVSLDLFDRALVDQWPHLHAWLQTIADLHLRSDFGQTLGESIVNTALHVDPVGAHARLAGIAILRRDCAAHGRLEIGIVEHDEWRISAELEREL